MDQLESQLARDLQWSIESASLIDCELPEEFDWSKCPKQKISHLQQSMPQPNTKRVGRYFELLVEFWLREIQELEIIASQQQIQQDGRTIGEIDFLYRNHRGELCHCETAVKFYLHLPESNSAGSHFIGPNAADNFEKKTERLFHHQLQISRDHFPDVKRRIAFVKGRIFYRPNEPRPRKLPERLSASHLAGTWIRSSQLKSLEGLYPDCVFQVLKKPYWLTNEAATSIDSHDDLSQITNRLVKHFQTDRKPLMLSAMKLDGKVATEVDRLFVVSDDWPD